MPEAEHPENEADRLAALLAYGVLDTDPEDAFDDLTRIASELCGTPIALVSLVDAERQWFKSRAGLAAVQTPRELAFCAHAILEPDEVMVVPDALRDVRFHDNPLATGEPHVRAYAGAPLVNPDGHSLGTLCVIDHVSREFSEPQLAALRALARQVVTQLELRKQNRALREIALEVEQANSELRQFTSFAAHDLREPLRKLISFSGLLREDLGESLPPEAADDLRYIVASAERMERLVAALLKLSSAGSRPLSKEWFGLDTCVYAALEDLDLCVKESGAEVDIDVLPIVHGDRELLTQVFQNLLGNALKFVSSDRPRIAVTCSTETGEEVFGVRDNGIGMDTRCAEAIFAPFKQLHARDVYQGTGIGLAIVKKVIERHGGRVGFESEPGVGSHFTFTLDKPDPPA